MTSVVCMLPWCDKPTVAGESVCLDCDWRAEEWARGELAKWITPPDSSPAP